MAEKQVKQFTDTLRDIRGGEVIEDLTTRFREVVAAVSLMGGKGSLKLTLSVKRASKGAGNTLVIVDDIKTVLPVAEKGETILFATEDGTLQRNDPRQPRLSGMEGGRATVHTMPAAAEAPTGKDAAAGAQ